MDGSRPVQLPVASSVLVLCIVRTDGGLVAAAAPRSSSFVLILITALSWVQSLDFVWPSSAFVLEFFLLCALFSNPPGDAASAEAGSVGAAARSHVMLHNKSKRNPPVVGCCHFTTIASKVMDGQGLDFGHGQGQG